MDRWKLNLTADGYTKKHLISTWHEPTFRPNFRNTLNLSRNRTIKNKIATL